MHVEEHSVSTLLLLAKWEVSVAPFAQIRQSPLLNQTRFPPLRQLMRPVTDVPKMQSVQELTHQRLVDGRIATPLVSAPVIQALLLPLPLAHPVTPVVVCQIVVAGVKCPYQSLVQPYNRAFVFHNRMHKNAQEMYSPVIMEDPSYLKSHRCVPEMKSILI
jgi:hypothetical protein